MGIQEYQTAVDGQLYILRNSTDPVQIDASYRALNELRSRIIERKIRRLENLVDRIDEALTPMHEEEEPISRYDVHAMLEPADNTTFLGITSCLSIIMLVTAYVTCYAVGAMTSATRHDEL